MIHAMLSNHPHTPPPLPIGPKWGHEENFSSRRKERKTIACPQAPPSRSEASPLAASRKSIQLTIRLGLRISEAVTDLLKILWDILVDNLQMSWFTSINRLVKKFAWGFHQHSTTNFARTSGCLIEIDIQNQNPNVWFFNLKTFKDAPNGMDSRYANIWTDYPQHLLNFAKIAIFFWRNKQKITNAKAELTD